MGRKVWAFYSNACCFALWCVSSNELIQLLYFLVLVTTRGMWLSVVVTMCPNYGMWHAGCECNSNSITIV